MTSAHILLRSINLDVPPGIRKNVFSDAGAKAIYFSLVAIAFAFVSILLTGIQA